jgi:hypothetical protein
MTDPREDFPDFLKEETERYIRSLFHHYGVHLDGIVNGNRHLREVQRDRATTLPQKLPSAYRISLHIDDEEIVCTMGRQYGYNVYQLNAQDDEWEEKNLERAEEIRRNQFAGNGSSDTQ